MKIRLVKARKDYIVDEWPEYNIKKGEFYWDCKNRAPLYIFTESRCDQVGIRYENTKIPFLSEYMYEIIHKILIDMFGWCCGEFVSEKDFILKNQSLEDVFLKMFHEKRRKINESNCNN